VSDITGILSLGTRRDASTWEEGCGALGIKARLPIKSANPSVADLKTFFAGKGGWFFFGGHFGGRTLSNERGDVEVRFDAKEVRITAAGTKLVLSKATHEFSLHEECAVVLWGGCSVCGDPDTVETLRTLFGPHLLLGFAGLTGWRVVDAMLGGGFMKKGHFFDRLEPGRLDAVTVRDAWMGAALQGYGGGDIEGRFRAVDPEGQEWKLVKKKINRGRKY